MKEKVPTSEPELPFDPKPKRSEEDLRESIYRKNKSGEGLDSEELKFLREEWERTRAEDHEDAVRTNRRF